jgi:nucleoside-diphosphate-sugar epimerase
MKILVTGACGYKGNVLVPKLLNAGHKVTAFDIMWFGNDLKPHANLEVIRGDVRNVECIPLKGVDAIIHLSSIANDPAGDLDPKLTWEVSALATMQIADEAYREGIKHFIYASSGSVYGLKEEPQVTEDLKLVPMSEYNKTKMVAERVVLSYSDRMVVQIVRPATVCGLSPRMRLDVSVNMLTMQALTRGEITVLGGDQTRPNIHIDDITDLYLFLLNRPELTGIYNAGFENLSIRSIAEMVCEKSSAKIRVLPSLDLRSYRVNSDKLLSTGFKPRKTVSMAIDDICLAYQEGRLSNEERFYTLEWMEKTVFNIEKMPQP